jgi:magnesium-transporting ATPase (P-type)
MHKIDADTVIFVKGAPEVVMRMCAAFDAEWARTEVHRLASAGYRVLAVAEGPRVTGVPDFSSDHLQGLNLLGFAALIDPLRSEAPQAVAEARAAGIDVRMITGDHPETALAIARQLDPAWSPMTALTGAELAKMTGQDRTNAIRDAAVFARVEPAQKYLIVTELQAQGHFVAVTGDGVNDAPALRAAHVGVAMGAGGTDVARAAASLIIADDNFASIVAGVEEGRAAYDNIRKIVWFLISTGIAEIAVFALSLFSGGAMPLTAVQILWLNLVHEGVQDVALSLEGKEPDAMRKPPRRPKEPIFDRRMIEQCLAVGLYCGAAAFALFTWLRHSMDYDLAAARNLTLLFMVSYSNFHALNCRSETRSFFVVPIKTNPLLIASLVVTQAIHVGAMHLPLFQNALGLAPISLAEWVGVVALAASVLALGEGYKIFRAAIGGDLATSAH